MTSSFVRAAAGAAVFVTIVAAAPAATSDEKLGAGVQIDQATPIADIVASPDKFVGMTLRVDGVATAVCSHMGCWMAVAASDAADAPVVRVKVDDGVIVFPVTAKGKRVSAQGVIEKIAATDAESLEAASEQAKKATPADKASADMAAKYQLKATGAVIRN